MGNREFWEVGYDFLKSMSGLKEVDLVYFNQTSNKGTAMSKRMKGRNSSERYRDEFFQHPGLDISQMMNELGGPSKPANFRDEADSEAHRKIQDLATGRAG